MGFFIAVKILTKIDLELNFFKKSKKQFKSQIKLIKKSHILIQVLLL